jgi:hypothetical protein
MSFALLIFINRLYQLNKMFYVLFKIIWISLLNSLNNHFTLIFLISWN